jgi:DNA repair protein RadA/Sms
VVRATSRYVCQACGASTVRWEGRCPRCGEWESLVETLVRDGGPTARGPAPASVAAAVPLRALEVPTLQRLPTGIGELDRVLGGGLVPGSLVLLGGEPGIGKSTLVLEAAAGIAGTDGDTGDVRRVLYASGEESAAQLRLRADRLGLLEMPAGQHVHVLAETEVERIVAAAGTDRPLLLVIDSIQTMTLDGLDGPAGSVGQVRECAHRLLGWAKSAGVPVILVGHVTKEGTLAGPRTLEHLVDAVLTLEGERAGGLRVLRGVKNRFGSTDEVGVFEMAGDGLREVADPSRQFASEATQGAPGVALGVALGGSRPLMVEIQALVAPTGLATPRRTARGLASDRLALLLAVLARRAGVPLGTHDVYTTLPGGLSSEDPALDLPLSLALASSARDRPLLPGTVAIGEVGLLGETRAVAGVARRVAEAARLGAERVLVPSRSLPDLPVDRPAEPAVIGVDDLRHALRLALAAEGDTTGG